MTTVRFAEVFSRLEQEHHVQEWRCGGVRIWPLVKFLLAREVDDYTKDKKLFHLKHNFAIRDKLSYGTRIIADSFANRSLANSGQADVCLLTYEAFRHFQTSDGWFNIFQYPLIHACARMGLSLHTLELLNVYPARRPHLNETESVTLPIVLARIAAPLSFRPRRLREEIHQILSALDACRDILDIGDLAPLKREIAATIPVLFAMAKMFRDRLQVIRPRLTLMSNYYSISGLAFCLASHQLGIRSADISHGASGHYHYAYGGWRSAPSGGYELLPKDFLARTAEDAKALESLVAGSADYRMPVVVGDLAAHTWRDNLNGIANTARAALNARRNPRVDGRIEILIAAQDLGSLPPSFFEVIERAKDWCFFWIRFHPVYLSYLGQFSLPFDHECCDLVQATSAPLFALLERVDGVLTETSSVATDAQAWNVPAVIAHQFGELMFSEYIANGSMVAAGTADGIVAALRKIADARRAGVAKTHDVEFREQKRRLDAYIADTTR